MLPFKTCLRVFIQRYRGLGNYLGLDLDFNRLGECIHAQQPGYPTSPFIILELQNPSHDISELHTIHRSPDLEALKLWKGSSDNYRPVWPGGTSTIRLQLQTKQLYVSFVCIYNHAGVTSIIFHHLRRIGKAQKSRAMSLCGIYLLCMRRITFLNCRGNVLCR